MRFLFDQNVLREKLNIHRSLACRTRKHGGKTIAQGHATQLQDQIIAITNQQLADDL